jgi:hypothetical protein
MQTGTLVDQFLNTPQNIHIQWVTSDAWDPSTVQNRFLTAASLPPTIFPVVSPLGFSLHENDHQTNRDVRSVRA